VVALPSFCFIYLFQLLQLLVVLVEKAARRRIHHRLGVPHLPALSHLARALEPAANAERRGGSSVGGA
jgi:hypothetical protein